MENVLSQEQREKRKDGSRRGRMMMERCGKGRQNSLCDWVGVYVAKSWLALTKNKY